MENSKKKKRMQSPQEKAMKAHMSWYFFFFPE
jgi:hypothetical protein